MKNIGEFSANGYEMSIISTDLFTEYLINKKYKAKKLFSYFDINKKIFFETIKGGKLLPFIKFPGLST